MAGARVAIADREAAQRAERVDDHAQRGDRRDHDTASKRRDRRADVRRDLHATSVRAPTKLRARELSHEGCARIACDAHRLRDTIAVMGRVLLVVIALGVAGCDDYNGPECQSVLDCGDPTCANLVCEDNHCGIRPLPAGAPATIQTDGDCQLATCDGHGGVVPKADDGDLPAADGACLVPACNDGVASNRPAQAGTTCGTDMFCDNVGQCVGCFTAFECPGADTPCQQRTCTNEVCGVTSSAAGTACGTTANPHQCDGNGACV
jgi:hypothetical protein